MLIKLIVRVRHALMTYPQQSYDVSVHVYTYTKPSLDEPISTAACYDWPTRTAKLARAHIASFTETSEAEPFHDPVSVTQTRRSESAGYNHCCLPESGDG